MPIVVAQTDREASAAIYEGSASVRVTDDTIALERFDRERFPAFAKDSLTRYFRIGSKVNIVSRATGQNAIQDLEVVGPARCLAPSISRTGWQKLRLEFSYKIDDVYLARSAKVRFEISVRFVSGEIADFQPDHEPPADRFKQIAPAELTDLANRLGGFIRQEMNNACFDRQGLNYCPTPVEPCQ